MVVAPILVLPAAVLSWSFRTNSSLAECSCACISKWDDALAKHFFAVVLYVLFIPTVDAVTAIVRHKLVAHVPRFSLL